MIINYYDSNKIASIKATKPRQLEKLKSQIIECVANKDLLKTIKNLINTLIPVAEQTYNKSLLMTNSKNSRMELKKHEKLINTNEQ